MKGVLSPNPGGAFYTIAKLPVDDADRFCQWILSDFEYKNQTVMMAPGSGFYSTPGLGKDEVRIAYVLNLNDLKEAFDTLERALNDVAQNDMRESCRKLAEAEYDAQHQAKRYISLFETLI